MTPSITDSNTLLEDLRKHAIRRTGPLFVSYDAVNCECLVFRFGMFLAVTINAFIIFIIHIIFIILLVFVVFVVFVVFLDVISCIVIVVFAVLKMFVANLVPNVIHVRFSKAKGHTTRTREDGGIG